MKKNIILTLVVLAFFTVLGRAEDKEKRIRFVGESSTLPFLAGIEESVSLDAIGMRLVKGKISVQNGTVKNDLGNYVAEANWGSFLDFYVKWGGVCIVL